MVDLEAFAVGGGEGRGEGIVIRELLNSQDPPKALVSQPCEDYYVVDIPRTAQQATIPLGESMSVYRC